MPNSSPLRFLRKTLLDVSDPKFLLEREKAAEEGAIDFASSINHEAGVNALYPPFDPLSIKQKALSILSHGSSAQLGPRNLLFTRGSSEGIDLCLRACLSEGSGSAVYAYPTFPMYEYWARISGIRTQRFALEGNYCQVLPVEKMRDCGAILAFICNPNSPTGIPFSVSEVVSFVSQFPGIVVVDEAYVDFCSSYSLLSKLHELPNALVLRSFSKSWGLAGARLGCILGDERLIAALRVLQGPFGLSTPSEDTLFGCLSAPEDQQRYIALMATERARISTAL